MAKHTVLLIYGGESPEHDVSIRSAHNVYAALDDEKYTVELCYIDRAGRWWLTESIDGSHVGRPQLIPVLGQKQFITLPGNHTIRPDILFPILHGEHGEDGTVQGVAQMLHIACVGPSLAGAAISMDKEVTKRLLHEADIPVVPWLVWHEGDELLRFDVAKETLGLPMFVKPSGAGSSVGVTKIKTAGEWRAALELAAKYDSKVLIEKAIDAREIEVAVLGNEHVRVSGAGEIIPGDVFYSYDDKYAAASTARAVIPAELDDDVHEKVREFARRGYIATQGHGMARVDIFVDKHNGEIYVNEINSIPGFTNISMYPKLWRASGMSYSQLVDELIALALERV